MFPELSCFQPTNPVFPLAIWLQWWTDFNVKHPNENVGYWLGVYFGLAALAVLGCMGSDWYVSGKKGNGEGS